MPGWRFRKAMVTDTALLPYVAFALFPLYIMLITSLKSKQESNDLSASPFWATGFTLENYRYLAEHPHFFDHWLLNTVIVTVLATTSSVVIGILAAYALARRRFRGVECFGVGVFVTYLIPTSLLFLPLIDLINFLDRLLPLRDTYWALVLTYLLIPFVTWLLMGDFRTVPFEVEECAYIDGCGRLRALLTMVLPMAIPGVACAMLFAFTLCWHEFLYSLVFIQDELAKPLSVGVFTELVRGDIYVWGSLMAACLAGSLPIIGVYTFFRDYYVSGLTAGAIK
jgi:multiple sugar transport system permease protein